jgi:hypothetical protein
MKCLFIVVHKYIKFATFWKEINSLPGYLEILFKKHVIPNHQGVWEYDNDW